MRLMHERRKSIDKDIFLCGDGNATARRFLPKAGLAYTND